MSGVTVISELGITVHDGKDRISANKRVNEEIPFFSSIKYPYI
jgi:hypothetical protein